MDRTRPGPRTSITARVRLTKLDWLLLALILVLAVFFRFWQMGHIPPGMDFDEAFESLEARRILTQPGYHPIFFPGNNGVPALKIYLTALAFLVAGEQMLAIRYVSAIIGTLTVLSLYLLARLLFPLTTAPSSNDAPEEPGASSVVRALLPFTASFLLAVLPWHTAFSRRGVEVVLLPLWAILAVFFLWQGLTTRRWWPFVVSGIFWGSAAYTYQAAWFLPGVLVLFLVYKAFQERGFLRRYALHLLLVALVSLLMMFPLIQFGYHHPSVLFQRTAQVTFFGKGQGSEAPLLNLARNTLKIAGVFVLGGDPNASDQLTNRPPIPFALAAALCLGLLIALRRFNRAEYALLLIWFAWMLVPSILSDDVPSLRRAIGAAPAVMLLIALGIGWLFDVVRHRAYDRRIWRAWAPGLAGVALAATLIFTMSWSYRYYFIEWGTGKQLFRWFDVGLVEIGQYAASTPADTRLYYTPVSEVDVLHLPVTWQVRDRELRTFDGRLGLVLAPPDTHPSLYLITTWHTSPWPLEALQEFYPDGRVVYSVSNPDGERHSLAFAVDPNTVPTLPLNDQVKTSFEDGIDLLGTTLSSNEIRAGETLTVTLFWQSTAGPTQMSHTVFTHMLGPAQADGSNVWAGHDGPPLGNTHPTSRWEQGEIIVDRHTFTVAADAPPGVYQIETGLYTPERRGARLRILDAAGQPAGDNVIVGAVTVR